MLLRKCIPISGRFAGVALFAVQPGMKFRVSIVLSATVLSSIVSIVLHGEMASLAKAQRLSTTERQTLLLISEQTAT